MAIVPKYRSFSRIIWRQIAQISEAGEVKERRRRPQQMMRVEGDKPALEECVQGPVAGRAAARLSSISAFAIAMEGGLPSKVWEGNASAKTRADDVHDIPHNRPRNIHGVAHFFRP